MTQLLTQSTVKYTLLKDDKTKLYYIKRNKDSKTVLIGDNEDAYDFILYGLDANKEEITTLFK